MFRFPLLFLSLCFLQLVFAVDPVVDLGYAKYRGVHNGKDVVRWAGMRYARSVSRVDGMRFSPPQDPVPEPSGQIVNASDFGSLCIGALTNLKKEFGDKQSEDCLFVNVFAPAKAKNTSALPVYVFIQGGGFTVNGNANYNATDLINAADNQMVVVNFNYRVGPYGFLASKEIVDDKSLGLNNGLKDQRQLLKWVQTYIHNFGGDPDHVTLGGASAGAGSVVLQLTAYGGRNDNLFHAVAAESPAFPPMRNVTASQFAYDALLKQTGCADLKCMRDMDTVTFQKAVRALKLKFPRAAGPPIYFWGPTLDYDFIRDYTFREIKAGHFVKVPTIFGDSSNEGMTFTPNTVTNQQRAEQFLANQWPTIGPNQVQISEAWHGPVDMMFDSKWRSMAADVYGHIRYICPTLNISAAYADNGSYPIWQYRWNVGPAQHVGELLNIWHNGTSAAGVFMQSYFTSFIRSHDPNKHMTSYWPEGAAEMTSPRWEPFTKGEDGSGQGGRRMLFQDMNYVAMENVGSVERERCQVISNMGLQLEQAASPATRIRPLLLSFGFGHLAYIVPLLSLLQYFVT